MGSRAYRRSVGIFAILLTLPGCVAPAPKSAGSSEAPRAGSTSSPAEASTSSAADVPCPEQPTPPKPLTGPPVACAFPSEADQLGINSAKVRLLLCIDAAGNLISSHVLDDPGHGFAKVTLECVRWMRFQPGQDLNGNNAASGFVLNVRYMR